MKQYSDGKDLHSFVAYGVNKLADNVASTYDLRGRNVILRNKMENQSSQKMELLLRDLVNLKIRSRMQLEIVKQASEKTNLMLETNNCQPSLARAVFSKSLELIDKGLSPVEVKRLDKVCNLFVKRFQKHLDLYLVLMM